MICDSLIQLISCGLQIENLPVKQIHNKFKFSVQVEKKNVILQTQKHTFGKNHHIVCAYGSLINVLSNWPPQQQVALCQVKYPSAVGSSVKMSSVKSCTTLSLFWEIIKTKSCQHYYILDCFIQLSYLMNYWVYFAAAETCVSVVRFLGFFCYKINDVNQHYQLFAEAPKAHSRGHMPICIFVTSLFQYCLCILWGKSYAKALKI